MTALLPFLLALARAVPAVEDLLRLAVAERDRDREREALMRQQDKNAAVDAAIAEATKK